MSLQWTLIAGFLYLEIAVVLLLVLPVASPKRWQKIFKSRFIQTFSNQASWYFGLILLILVLFLLDAIREMRKYSSTDHPEGAHLHLDAEMQGNMRLFRAQRNFYISGFALFLSLVIRRLTSLISTQATLLAQSEAALAQAKSATTAARDILTKSSGEAAQNSTNEAHDKEITELKEKLTKTEKDLEHSKKDREAMVSQSQSLKNEYDRLLEEHRLLQVKVSKGEGDKKAD